MRSYLFRMIFTFTFFFTCYAMNAQLCVECPFNNCSYCWGYGGGGSGGGNGGGDEQIDNPGGGGGSSVCSMAIPLTSSLPGGVIANVSAGGGYCGAHVVYNTWGGSPCYIASSSTTCWPAYVHSSGSTYYFMVSHQEACMFSGIQTLYQHFYDSFYFEC